ncbi:hypothetical protein ACIBCO_34790 [Streptomyces violascens]|uniref:hypothetical protein n=1 Tax=Streptomyces violascens TaxID=67381 RepID=UPI0037AF5AF7
MDIEILVVPDCPNSAPAAALLRQALDDVGLHDAGFSVRVIADQTAAEAAAFTGSPSFLINGHDPFPEPGCAPGLACRVYRTPDGLAGLPEPEQLRQALAGALRADSESDSDAKGGTPGGQ